MKTLVIGLDGACSDVLDPLIEADALPRIETLLQRGASGPLRSQIPPWTASAWPSLYTGVNPGKHGVFDFLAFDGYDWDVVNATHVRAPTLWDILTERGLTSVLVNVPVTHPPAPIDGAIVPGYLAPEEPTCHPKGLLDDLRPAFGDYKVYPPHDGNVGIDEAIANYREQVAQREAVFRHLSRELDPAFGFLQFQATDSVFHELDGDAGAVESVYRAVDRAIDTVLEACDPDVVFLVSDHGIGPYDAYSFRVNEFLCEHGYVTTVAGREGGMPSWGTIRDRERKRTDRSTIAAQLEAVLSRAAVSGARVGATSQRVHRALDRVGLAEAVVQLVPDEAIQGATEQVDFTASQAYMRSRTELGVRINLEGREPEGVVPPEEYEVVREALIERLSAVRTPDGDPVFEEVLRREAVFSGPYLEDAADVIVVPDNFEQFLSARLLGQTFGEPEEPWNHKRDGIVAIAGADIDPDAALSRATLFDIAPTVLASLGVAIDERTDGDVLPVADFGDVETDRYAGYRAARRTDSPAVEDRLSHLGYLE